MFIFTFRVLSILLLLYSLSDASIPKELADHFNTQKGGRNQFLTIIGVQLTILTLLLNVLKYRRAHNFIYPIALATEFTISITFWFFYFTNPANLMRPIPGVETLLPFYMDIVYHLLPLLALIVEAFVIDLSAISLSPCTFAMVPIAYYIWAAYLSKSNGVWPYPMLDNMSSTKRMIYFGYYTLIGIVSSQIFVSVARRISRHCFKAKNDEPRQNVPENEDEQPRQVEQDVSSEDEQPSHVEDVSNEDEQPSHVEDVSSEDDQRSHTQEQSTPNTEQEENEK
ncbi:putative transporter [Trachipleistophora hominis]|uniref:Putative transporter n=1 Tax=Trachipleistophora hominis TaxID=72359 RepID=L7JYI5_TRAHO|nr:putative transporter [Trachipleistophora hominis]